MSTIKVYYLPFARSSFKVCRYIWICYIFWTTIQKCLRFTYAALVLIGVFALVYYFTPYLFNVLLASCYFGDCRIVPVIFIFIDKFQRVLVNVCNLLFRYVQISSAICFLRGKAYEALENRNQARQWFVSPFSSICCCLFFSFFFFLVLSGRFFIGYFICPWRIKILWWYLCFSLLKVQSSN